MPGPPRPGRPTGKSAGCSPTATVTGRPSIAEKAAQHRAEQRGPRAAFRAKFMRGQRTLLEADRERRRAEDLHDPAPLGRSERLEQLHDVRDALRGLHAARSRQLLAPLVHVDREADEQRDDEHAQLHENQAAEERARREPHRDAASTVAAST